MKRRSIFALAFSVCICVTTSFAQNQPDPDSMAAGLTGLKHYFEQSSPAVGSQVPNISVFTSDGKELGFRELMKEQYSVVIFGCLT